uniref:Phosphatidate cytidylyltransferase n=1 Tax=Gracilinema caldarium TaxID=215591 RepID=A0A7C3ELW0_9SPIR
MTKLVQRLLIFSLGIPAIIALVAYLPFYNHLAVNLVVTIISALGAVEFSQILAKKHYSLPPWEAAILGALAPAAMTLSISLNIPGELVPAAFIFGAGWLIASRVFSSLQDISQVLDRISAGLSVMIYPGIFMLWIIRMTRLPHATVIILSFLLMVFANDSLAWAVGMLFGKGNRGFIPASPNKSIAGFIGGMAGSLIIGIIAPLLFPAAFTTNHTLPRLIGGIILGICVGIVAIIGDLAESTIKRSGEVKDSGFIIPGRGGVLDSVDSIALAAPVFYALYWILF